MGLAHGLLDGLQIPSSVNRLKSALAILSFSGLNLLGGSATGWPVVTM